MKYVSLFSGGGGGDLGCQHLLGWECVGYVEWDKYCCRVLEQRIKDGLLSDAPIFCGDIRRWIELGYAAAYQGMVDVITGGFPCQPFSEAGKRLGADDPRNMWPATIECIRLVRPRYALLENVSELLSCGYFGTVLSDLAAAGYDARWSIFSACAPGAPHTRERVFILAHAQSARQLQCRRQQQSKNSDSQRDIRVWIDQPEPVRVANGVAHRMDRVKALGNGQVPAVVRAAWQLLTTA